MATMIDKDTISTEIKIVLEAHLAWLNGWHRHMEEGGRVELKDYWIRLGDQDIDWGPTLLLDTWSTIRDEVYWNVGRKYGKDHRMMVIDCTPYHDEGGPSTLTAFLERGYGWEDGEPGQWELRGLVQEFDTIHDLLMSEGKLVWNFQEQ